ncbi:lysylphosphatidylglycerol synthase transmembrane domain-containing protein [Flavobacterium microcysteis]|uniref:Flippase-like domain-containing protein n=1 Tax=Flavobacterium microcysteis TaxID=2596891 RepID=A0A501Q8B6_9FLAO|nr:lysylphosphatidylglycerol synthase transmembrane domain-containing protein [Flavobacterium microcysteis]TPD68575.1 flippase-like domain-containing protein [Flavobacterium microcysteis]
MKKKISKALSILLPILLGVFLTIYAYNSFTPEQLEEIKSYFRNADYTYILIALVFGFISHAARAYRWRFMLEHMGYHSPFKNNFMAVWIAYFMNMTIPRSGEVSRALVLKKYEDIPFDKAFGSIIAERVVDFIILLLFIATAVLLQFDVLKTFLLHTIPAEKLLVYGIVAFVIFLSAILLFIYSKSKWILMIKGKISGLTEGLLSVWRMEKKWSFLFYTAIIWLGYVLTFYTAIFALDETSGISFGVVVTAFVIGSLAISFSNGGFGVFPALISKILALYGISEEAGTAFGWIIWTSQTVQIIILGGLSFLLLPILNRKK